MKSRQTVVVLGAQWGDEGKGKIVDWYAKDFDYIVRYSGGDNAGHTVRVGEEIFKFHLIPSGILYPEKTNVLANGMVVNPTTLLEEIKNLTERGYSVQNLVISNHAHVIMPWHKMLDGAEETVRQERKIGTTQRGIGPTYQDKVGRTEAIRVADLVTEDVLREKIERILPSKKLILERYGIKAKWSLEDLLKIYVEYGRHLKSYVKNTRYLLNDAVDQGKRILLEGAQGTLLDVDHGTYPYVTSSNPTIGGVCTGTGIPANKIDRVIGVAKAYTTRVGRGPLPTELGSEKEMENEVKDDKLTDADFHKANTGDAYFLGRILRKQGMEYGTTTGRPRRCGWFDAVIVKYAVMVNGITELAITKLDVLSGLKEIKVCVAYEVNGEMITEFPSDTRDLEGVKPIYESFQGWKRLERQEWLDIARGKTELPIEANNYLGSIIEVVRTPISLVSVGPEREATIVQKRD